MAAALSRRHLLVSLLLISLLLRNAAASRPFTDRWTGLTPTNLVNVSITADENPRMLQTTTEGACASSLSTVSNGGWDLATRNYCPVYPSTGVAWYSASSGSLTETFTLTCSSGYYATSSSLTATCVMSAVAALPSGHASILSCSCSSGTCPCIYDPVSATYKLAPSMANGCSAACSSAILLSSGSITDFVTTTRTVSVPSCDPNAIIRSVKLSSVSHTYIGDIRITFRRGTVSFVCDNMLGGGVGVSGVDWTFQDGYTAFGASGSYGTNTYGCAGGNFATLFSAQTGEFSVDVWDGGPADTGSFTGITVTFESGSQPSACPNRADTCSTVGRSTSISYPTATCASCSSRFSSTTSATVSSLSSTQYSWACNAGYYGTSTTQTCNTDGTVSGSAISCTDCVTSLPTAPTGSTSTQVNSTTWKYTCSTGYTGGTVYYTCVSTSTNGGFGTQTLTCTPVTPSVTPSWSFSPTRTLTPTITPSFSMSTSVSGSNTPSVTGTMSFSNTPSVTVTNSRSASVTTTGSVSPSVSGTSTLSTTATGSVTTTASASQTVTRSASTTVTMSASPTWTATVTLSPTPTVTMSLTPSGTWTATSTWSGTGTQTYSSTVTLTPTPTPSLTATASGTGTITRTATESSSVTATQSMSASDTWTSTPTVSVTATESVSATSTWTSTPTATITATASLSSTPTWTSTASVSVTATESVSASATWTSTATTSLTATQSVSATSTWTSTASISSTATVSMTATVSATASLSSTPTWTSTASVSVTATESVSATSTWTATATGSLTATQSVSATSTWTSTASISSTATVSMTATESETSTRTSTASISSTATQSLSSTPTWTSTASTSATATQSMSSSATWTATASVSATATESRSVSPSGTWTPTSSLSPTATESVSVSPSGTWTSTASVSVTATESVSATSTLSATPSGSITATESMSASDTWTSTASISSTATVTMSASNTETQTSTSSVSVTATESRSSTPSDTHTATASVSATATQSISATSTWTSTSSLSATSTGSETATSSLSSTPTLTSTPSSSATATESMSISLSSTWTATGSTSPTATESVSATGSWTASVSSSSTATETSTPSGSVSATQSASATSTWTSTASLSASATVSMTATVSETATATGSLSATPTQSTSATATLSSTATVSLSPSGTESVSASATSSSSVTCSVSATATESRTLSPTPTLTSTASQSATMSESMSISISVTPSASGSLTSSGTESTSMTASNTLTPTASWTATATDSVTVTSSGTYTATGSLSPTPTATMSVSATETSTFSSTSTHTQTPTGTRTISESSTVSRTMTVTSSVSSTATVTSSATHTVTRTASQTPTLSSTPTWTQSPGAVAVERMNSTSYPATAVLSNLVESFSASMMASNPGSLVVVSSAGMEPQPFVVGLSNALSRPGFKIQVSCADDSILAFPSPYLLAVGQMSATLQLWQHYESESVSQSTSTCYVKVEEPAGSTISSRNLAVISPASSWGLFQDVLLHQRGVQLKNAWGKIFVTVDLQRDMCCPDQVNATYESPCMNTCAVSNATTDAAILRAAADKSVLSSSSAPSTAFTIVLSEAAVLTLIASVYDTNSSGGVWNQGPYRDDTRVLVNGVDCDILWVDPYGFLLTIQVPTMQQLCPVMDWTGDCGYKVIDIITPSIVGNTLGASELGTTVSCPPLCPNEIKDDVMTIGVKTGNGTKLMLAHKSEDNTPIIQTSDDEASLGLYFTQSCTASGFADLGPEVCLNTSDPSFSQCSFGTGASCRLCPGGAMCPGGSRAWPLPGYYTPSERLGIITECPPPDGRCQYWDNAISKVKCGTGFQTGSFLCLSCAKGYYAESDGTCSTCPTATSLLDVIKVAAVFYAIMIAGVSVFYCIALIALKVYGGSFSNMVKNFTNLCAWTFTVVQTIGQIGKAAGPGMPATLKSIYNVMLAFQFEGATIPASCLGVDPFIGTIYAFVGALCVLALLCFLSAYQLRGCCFKRCGGKGAPPLTVLSITSSARLSDNLSMSSGALEGAKGGGRTPNKKKRRRLPKMTAATLAKICGIVLALMYAPITNAVLQIVVCTPTEMPVRTYLGLDNDGTTLAQSGLHFSDPATSAELSQLMTVPLLQVDPSVVCYEGSHGRAYTVSLIVSVLYLFCFPAVPILLVSWRIASIMRKSARGNEWEAAAQRAKKGSCRSPTACVRDTLILLCGREGAYKCRRLGKACCCCCARMDATTWNTTTQDKLVNISLAVKNDPILAPFVQRDFVATMFWFAAVDAMLQCALAVIGRVWMFPTSVADVRLKAIICCAMLTVAAYLYETRRPYHPAQGWQTHVKAFALFISGLGVIENAIVAEVVGFDSELEFLIEPVAIVLLAGSLLLFLMLGVGFIVSIFAGQASERRFMQMGNLRLDTTMGKMATRLTNCSWLCGAAPASQRAHEDDTYEFEIPPTVTSQAPIMFTIDENDTVDRHDRDDSSNTGDYEYSDIEPEKPEIPDWLYEDSDTDTEILPELPEPPSWLYDLDHDEEKVVHPQSNIEELYVRQTTKQQKLKKTQKGGRYLLPTPSFKGPNALKQPGTDPAPISKKLNLQAAPSQQGLATISEVLEAQQAKLSRVAPIKPTSHLLKSTASFIASKRTASVKPTQSVGDIVVMNMKTARSGKVENNTVSSNANGKTPRIQSKVIKRAPSTVTLAQTSSYYESWTSPRAAVPTNTAPPSDPEPLVQSPPPQPSNATLVAASIAASMKHRYALKHPGVTDIPAGQQMADGQTPGVPPAPMDLSAASHAVQVAIRIASSAKLMDLLQQSSPDKQALTARYGAPSSRSVLNPSTRSPATLTSPASARSFALVNPRQAAEKTDHVSPTLNVRPLRSAVPPLMATSNSDTYDKDYDDQPGHSPLQADDADKRVVPADDGVEEPGDLPIQIEARIGAEKSPASKHWETAAASARQVTANMTSPMSFRDMVIMSGRGTHVIHEWEDEGDDNEAEGIEGEDSGGEVGEESHAYIPGMDVVRTPVYRGSDTTKSVLTHAPFSTKAPPVVVRSNVAHLTSASKAALSSTGDIPAAVSSSHRAGNVVRAAPTTLQSRYNPGAVEEEEDDLSGDDLDVSPAYLAPLQTERETTSMHSKSTRVLTQANMSARLLRAAPSFSARHSAAISNASAVLSGKEPAAPGTVGRRAAGRSKQHKAPDALEHLESVREMVHPGMTTARIASVSNIAAAQPGVKQRNAWNTDTADRDTSPATDKPSYAVRSMAASSQHALASTESFMAQPSARGAAGIRGRAPPPSLSPAESTHNMAPLDVAAYASFMHRPVDRATGPPVSFVSDTRTTPSPVSLPPPPLSTTTATTSSQQISPVPPGLLHRVKSRLRVGTGATVSPDVSPANSRQ